MKKLLFLIIIIVCSCEDRCEVFSDEFLNKSGRKIEIYVYKNYQQNSPLGIFSVKHTLEDNASLKRQIKQCSPSFARLNIHDLLQGDSIVIDFGDRKLRYGSKNLSSLRNPTYLAIINPNPYNFIYTLTPDDYANALP